MKMSSSVVRDAEAITRAPLMYGTRNQGTLQLGIVECRY